MEASLNLSEEEIGQPLSIESEGTITLRYKVVGINSFESEGINYTLKCEVESCTPEMVDLYKAGQIAMRRMPSVEPQP